MKNIIFIIGVSFSLITKLIGQNPCNLQVNDVLLHGDLVSTHLQQSPTFFDDKVFLLDGKLIVDINVKFTRCTFIMNSLNAEIEISPNINLEIESCFFGCSKWKGISGINNNFINVYDSHFEKFAKGIKLVNPFGLIIDNNTFQSELDNFGIGTNTGVNIINSQSNQISTPLFYGIIFIGGNKFNNCSKGADLEACNSIDFSDNNIFFHCLIGIKSNYSNVSVYNSYFQYCWTGIELRNSNLFCYGNPDDNVNYDFLEAGFSAINGINSYIYITNTSMKNCLYEINAALSIVDATDSRYRFEYHPEAVGAFIFSDNNILVSAYRDTIHSLNEDGYGFNIQGGSAYLLENNVYVNNENQLGNTAHETNFFMLMNELILENNVVDASVLLMGCRKNGLFGNTFNYSASKVKVKLYNCTQNLFCENKFYNKTTLRFEDECQQTSLATSQFWQTDGGLELLDSGIRTQSHKGNIWESPTSFAEKLTIDHFGRFLINLSANPKFQPTIIKQVNPHIWFIDLNEPVNNCISSFTPFTDPDDDDYSMILGTFQSTLFSNWNQKLITYNKIVLNESLFQNVQNLASFISSCQNSDVDNIVHIQNILASLNNDIFFENMKSSLNYFKLTSNQYHNLKNEMYLNNNFNILNTVNNLQSELITKYNTYISDFDDYMTNRNINLNMALQVNETIVGDNNFSLYEETINQYYLQKLLDLNFSLNPNVYAEIESIAEMCPKEFGIPIIKAIDLLNPLDQQRIINTMDCNQNPNQLVAKNLDLIYLNKIDTKSSHEDINFNLNSEFTIYSIDGIKINSSLSELKRGLYLIEISRSGEHKIIKYFKH